MPYKKNTKRKIRRHPHKKRGPTTKQLATRIKKLEHTEELKYIDVLNSTALSTTGTSLVLSVLAQGDDFNNRVGEEVRAKYVNCKLRLAKTTPSANINQVRCILFWDLQTNGSGPVILTSTLADSGLLDNSSITSVLLSPHNYRCSQRYKILYDKVHVLNPDSTTTQMARYIHINKRLGGAKIKYTDSSGTIASLTSRALCFSILSDTSSTTEITPTLCFRVWYTDS